MMHVHANGILKEIEVPSHTNFETMCRDILIESRLFIAHKKFWRIFEKRVIK